MREILFRGKRVDNGEWIEGDLIQSGERFFIITKLDFSYWCYNDARSMLVEVIPETIGQFTGLTDKNGKKIFEGDILRYRKPYRTTQTHTGDNIPNGSYTEPMEPEIKTLKIDVLFKDGSFTTDESLISDDTITPLSWFITQYDEESIKDSISVHREGWSIWDDEEEGDLQYLLENYHLENLQALIDYVSGVEIIGNIHDKNTQS